MPDAICRTAALRSMMHNGCFDRPNLGRHNEFANKMATFERRRGVVQATNHSAGQAFSAFLFDWVRQTNASGALLL